VSSCGERRPGSGLPADEANAQAGNSTVLLLSAAELGLRDFGTYSDASALDPLRDRPDFRALMLDLAFPSEPFAPDR
jgi:eukaryotic-like serine/threonine-protein kinase